MSSTDSDDDGDEMEEEVEEEEEEKNVYNVLASDEFDDAFFLDYSNFSKRSFKNYVEGRDVWKVWLLCDSDDFSFKTDLSTTTSEESLSQIFTEMFYDDLQDDLDIEFSVEINERCYLKAQDKWLAKMKVFVGGN
jgi:hypothetical protein